MRQILTRIAAVSYIAAAAAMSLSCGQDNLNENILWYTTPASAWEEALPAGNGRLGAMVFGYTGKERIQFNENTLYSGGPQPDLGIDIREDLGTVRKLLAEGKNAEAGELMQEKWIGRLNEAYQPFGDLYLDFGDSSDVSEYRHELDMGNGVVKTSYVKDGAKVSREVFVSHPDQAIVVHISADRPVLDFTASLDSRHPVRTACMEGNAVMTGRAPAHAQRRDIANMRKFHTERLHPEYFRPDGSVIREDHVIYEDGRGMAFEAMLVPYSHSDGELSVSEDGVIRAEGCSEVTLLLYAATSFNGFDRSPSSSGKDPHAEIGKYRSLLCGTDAYTDIKERHTRDFSSLYDRVSLDLPSTAAQRRMPTDRRLAAYRDREDPGLTALLFRFGRYLMISGSRPGGQPLNLQQSVRVPLSAVPAHKGDFGKRAHDRTGHVRAGRMDHTPQHFPLEGGLAVRRIRVLVLLEHVRAVALQPYLGALSLHRRPGFSPGVLPCDARCCGILLRVAGGKQRRRTRDSGQHISRKCLSDAGRHSGLGL